MLPHLYEDYGPDFVHHFRGMFATALWDMREQRLLLVRDRLGKKPLFYTRYKGSFRFASESKAVFADRSVPHEPDLEALHYYLCLQYVPAPWTAFVGIKALPPAATVRASSKARTFYKEWFLRTHDADGISSIPSMTREMMPARLVRFCE